MERRRAVAIAAATATTTLGVVAAIAANFGLLGLGVGDREPLGKLNAGQVVGIVDPPAPSASAPASVPGVIVRYEDVYLPTAAPATSATSAVSASPPPTAAPPVQPNDDPATVSAADLGVSPTGGSTRETSEAEADHDDRGDDHERPEAEEDD